MLYLLDTNIVSYLIKRTFPALVHRVRMTTGQVFLSAVNEAELRFGLALLPAEAKSRSSTEDFLRYVAIRPWDSRCAVQYAAMGAAQRRTGRPLSPLDSMIAAHALAEDCVLVTNDQAFLHVEGLHVEDWTKGPEPA